MFHVIPESIDIFDIVVNHLLQSNPKVMIIPHSHLVSIIIIIVMIMIITVLHLCVIRSPSRVVTCVFSLEVCLSSSRSASVRTICRRSGSPREDA